MLHNLLTPPGEELDGLQIGHGLYDLSVRGVKYCWAQKIPPSHFLPLLLCRSVRSTALPYKVHVDFLATAVAL